MQLEQRSFPIEKIEKNVLGFRNSRSDIGDTRDLQGSIVSDGLLNPPIVHITNDSDGNERIVLVAGYRRMQAIHDERQARGDSGTEDGWFDEISCGVHDGDLDDALALNISENLQRETLNFADKCEAVYRLNERVGTQERVASMLNISQPQVSVLCSTYRGLSTVAFEALRHGRITMTQAKKLAKVVKPDGTPNEKGQDDILEEILGHGKDEVPETKQRKRAKTYRSKKEMEELRTHLASNRDEDLDKEYREALDRVVLWYFCEIETDDLLNIIDSVDEVTVKEEASTKKKKTVKRKRRIRIGE
jgi:ParB-like chromosome segregation protein Spo0J